MILGRLKNWWALRTGLADLDEHIHREAGFIHICALDCYRRQVGRCRLTWKSGSALFTLADIHVNLSWRSRGVGSALLRRAIDLANEEGACRIAGSVVESDLKSRPWLSEWYARFGFSIVPTTSDDLPGTLARIELTI